MTESNHNQRSSRNGGAVADQVAHMDHAAILSRLRRITRPMGWSA